MGNLLSLVRSDDWMGFREYLKTTRVNEVNPKEEVRFLKIGPKNWKEAFLRDRWPSSPAEKFLMKAGSQKLLELTYTYWGFSEENLIWAFKEASFFICRRVLACLKEQPAESVELAMLWRKDTEILKLWLEKFGELSETAEKMLEACDFQTMKSAYVDCMIKAQ